MFFKTYLAFKFCWKLAAASISCSSVSFLLVNAALLNGSGVWEHVYNQLCVDHAYASVFCTCGNYVCVCAYILMFECYTKYQHVLVCLLRTRTLLLCTMYMSHNTFTFDWLSLTLLNAHHKSGASGFPKDSSKTGDIIYIYIITYILVRIVLGIQKVLDISQPRATATLEQPCQRGLLQCFSSTFGLHEQMLLIQTVFHTCVHALIVVQANLVAYAKYCLFTDKYLKILRFSEAIYSHMCTAAISSASATDPVCLQSMRSFQASDWLCLMHDEFIGMSRTHCQT